MAYALIIAQIIVGISVGFVWIFRYDVIIEEFKLFGLSDLTRTFVGAAKVALATLLIAGIWHPTLVTIPAILMGLFMLAAQFFHFKIKNPFFKHLPSLIFLLICIFIAVASMNFI
jgi:hypothetical protein